MPVYSLISTGTLGLIADQKLRQTAITVFVSPVFEEIIDEGKGAEYRQLFGESPSLTRRNAGFR